MMAAKESDTLCIAEREVTPGQRVQLQIPVGRRVSGNEISLPVEVICGRWPGPRLFVCAAVHGDEINGVEIIRRVLRHRALRQIRGSLIAVPIVNLYGFVGLSRYLPDRRDLNRVFPGNEKGSLASRYAHHFFDGIVRQCDYGIDLHTAAVRRVNYPNVRGNLRVEAVRRIAEAFGCELVVNGAGKCPGSRSCVGESGDRAARGDLPGVREILPAFRPGGFRGIAAACL